MLYQLDNAMTRSSQDEQPLVAIQGIHVTFLRKIMRQMNIESPARYCVLLNRVPHWSHFLWHFHVDKIGFPNFPHNSIHVKLYFLEIPPWISPNFHVDKPPVLLIFMARSTRSTPGRTCWRGQARATGSPGSLNDAIQQECYWRCIVFYTKKRYKNWKVVQYGLLYTILLYGCIVYHSILMILSVFSQTFTSLMYYEILHTDILWVNCNDLTFLPLWNNKL